MGLKGRGPAAGAEAMGPFFQLTLKEQIQNTPCTRRGRRMTGSALSAWTFLTDEQNDIQIEGGLEGDHGRVDGKRMPMRDR